MDDYISKQVIIGILDAKANMALGAPKVVFSAAAKMVEKLPAADVVSVVRCRDCIHCEAGGYTDLLHCEYFDWGITADDFCSYGERKERHIRHCQNCKYASFLRSMLHPRPVFCAMKCKTIQEDHQRQKALFCIYFDSKDGDKN